MRSLRRATCARSPPRRPIFVVRVTPTPQRGVLRSYGMRRPSRRATRPSENFRPPFTRAQEESVSAAQRDVIDTTVDPHRPTRTENHREVTQSKFLRSEDDRPVTSRRGTGLLLARNGTSRRQQLFVTIEKPAATCGNFRGVSPVERPHPTHTGVRCPGRAPIRRLLRVRTLPEPAHTDRTHATDPMIHHSYAPSRVRPA